MRTKDSLLQLLTEENRLSPGAYLSGELLAARLGVSRAAVWKAVRALREDGLFIEAVTNRGYRLSAAPDVLDEGTIRRYLAEDLAALGRRIPAEDPGIGSRGDSADGPGKGSGGDSADGPGSGCGGTAEAAAKEWPPIRIFRTLPSTSITAKELAVGGAPHLTCVLADSQTQGTGHGGSAFASPKGGFYMSVVLRRLPQKDAVLKALTGLLPLPFEAGKNGSVRLFGKKVCGVLTESVIDLETGEFLWAVMGIGIRTDLLREASDREKKTPVSGISRNRLCAAILARL